MRQNQWPLITDKIDKLLDSQAYVFLFKTLIAAYLIGSGVVYGHFRLFHLLGIIFLPYFFATFVKEPRRLFKIDLLIMLIVLTWYAVSFFWVKDIILARNYFFYLLNGYYFVFVVCFVVTSFERLMQSFKILFFVVLANLFVGVLESLSEFRWFVARQSPHNPIFGIDPMYNFYYKNLMDRFKDYPVSYEFMLHQPSGFQWGPNQYGLFLCMILPFILFCVKKVWLSNLLVSVVLFLSFMASSRAVFIANLATILFSTLVFYFFSDFFTKKKLWFSGLMLVLILLIPYAPLYKMGVNYERAVKISSFLGVAKDYLEENNFSEAPGFNKLTPMQLRAYDVFEKEKKQQQKTDSTEMDVEGAASKDTVSMGTAVDKDNSVSSRKIMFVKALESFLQNKLRGVGLGSSAQDTGLLFGITQIHNFWAEILFELGFIFGLLVYIALASLFLRLCYLFYRAYQIKNSEYMMVLIALITSIVAAIPGVLAVGTAVYQSIFWLVLAFSLATVRIIGADKNISVDKSRG